MTWLHTIPLLGSLGTCCPVIRAAPNQTPHPGSPKQNLDDIRSGGNDQIAYRKLCSCNNFADGSWTYLGFPVYRVTSMRFLSCNDGMKNSTAQEKKDEAYFMALLKTVQSTPGLYFSYKTDITLNFQRRCKLVEGWMAKPIWKQADPRFVWNRNLLDELIKYKLDGFIIPLVQGNILNLLISYVDKNVEKRSQP